MSRRIVYLSLRAVKEEGEIEPAAVGTAPAPSRGERPKVPRPARESGAARERRLRAERSIRTWQLAAEGIAAPRIAARLAISRGTVYCELGYLRAMRGVMAEDEGSPATEGPAGIGQFGASGRSIEEGRGMREAKSVRGGQEIPRAVRKRVDQDTEIWRKHREGWKAQRIADYLQLSLGTIRRRLRYLRDLYPVIAGPSDEA